MKTKNKTMKIKNKFMVVAIIIIVIGASFLIVNLLTGKKSSATITEITPVSGDITLTVSTTGTVLPKNRLEIMPSVAGRIEKVLVQEGDMVKVGQVLVLMSSTDRAALIDAAKLQGADAVKYWKNAYKEISVVSPISGTVIVRSVEPGQSVNTSNEIVVISDRLIVKAQVDETDIGKVVVGQKASITLDSNSETVVNGTVTHIYYESKIVSNVTVYFVIITPETVPAEYRSGMSASVEIIEQEKKNVILIPQDAVLSDSTGNYVLIKKGDDMEFEKRAVSLGLSSDMNVEITGGISLNDLLIISSEKIEIDEKSEGKNPFVTERKERSGQKDPADRPERPEPQGENKQ